MSCASALYKSCVAHLAKWNTLFTAFKCFDEMFCLQTIEWENDEPHEQYLVERNVSIDDAEVNCLTNTNACLRSCKKSINHMQFIVR